MPAGGRLPRGVGPAEFAGEKALAIGPSQEPLEVVGISVAIGAANSSV